MLSCFSPRFLWSNADWGKDGSPRTWRKRRGFNDSTVKHNMPATACSNIFNLQQQEYFQRNEQAWTLKGKALKNIWLAAISWRKASVEVEFVDPPFDRSKIGNESCRKGIKDASADSQEQTRVYSSACFRDEGSAEQQDKIFSNGNIVRLRVGLEGDIQIDEKYARMPLGRYLFALPQFFSSFHCGLVFAAVEPKTTYFRELLPCYWELGTTSSSSTLNAWKLRSVLAQSLFYGYDRPEEACCACHSETAGILQFQNAQLSDYY